MHDLVQFVRTTRVHYTAVVRWNLLETVGCLNAAMCVGALGLLGSGCCLGTGFGMATN